MKDLERTLESGHANKNLQREYDELMAWLGVSDNQEKISRGQHEKFADSFVRYLETGKAPTSRLRDVFEKFRNWLRDVYNSFKGEGLSPEIHAWFERMLGGGNNSSLVEVNEADFLKGRKLPSIGKLVEAIETSPTVQKNSGRFFTDYARVTNEQAERIKQSTGFDVYGYSHMINGSTVQHSMSRHGDGKEKLAHQLPLTRSDFDMIPDVVSMPDTIVRGEVTKQGLSTIVSAKRINGHVLGNL